MDHVVYSEGISDIFYFKLQVKMKLGDEFHKTKTYKSKKYPNSFTGNNFFLFLFHFTSTHPSRH